MFRGKKVCLLHLGHITKIAVMPMYGKNPLKIFSGTKGPMPWGFYAALGTRGRIKFEKMMTLTCFTGRVKFFLHRLL